jgi:hypothetical protein
VTLRQRCAVGMMILLAVTTCAPVRPVTPTPTPTPTLTPAPPPTPPMPAYEPQPISIRVCAESCDFVSIQAAINDPGTSAGDVITVTDAVHTEAGIQVHKDVTIQGLGAGRTTVQAHERLGDAPDRVFYIPEGATAEIKGMTIRHGHPHVYPQGGGGIANFGTLTVEKCVVRDNSANDGGGIFNHGTMTVLNSSVHDNLGDRIAPPGYECGSGGGIKNGFRSTLTLENCTVAGNQALGKGGGLFVACEGTATVTNCTISGNFAKRDGGGVHIKGAATFAHCTVAQNESSQTGGGIYLRGTLDWSNCLVANNHKQDVTIGGEGGYKGTGVMGVNDHNWVADDSCDSQYSGDPMLGPLADNGGDALTHALLPGSPAIDLIPASACSLPYDQRGQSRPIQVGSGLPVCDVGAFEWQP